MTCAKCGALAAIVEYSDYFESHLALKCLCGKLEWLNPVPYAPPELYDYEADDNLATRG